MSRVVLYTDHLCTLLNYTLWYVIHIMLVCTYCTITTEYNNSNESSSFKQIENLLKGADKVKNHICIYMKNSPLSQETNSNPA